MRASCSTGSTRRPTRARPWCSTPARGRHYSLALYDACAQLTGPLVEVHLSDPERRPEKFRQTSVVTPHAKTVVVGKGVDGYREALRAL